MGVRKWTKEEEDYLRANYGKMTSVQLSTILNRQANTIRGKASKLGLTVPVINVRKKWTKKEEDFLKTNYKNMSLEDILLNLPGRGVHAIRQKCFKLGYSRDTPIPIGIGQRFTRLLIVKEIEQGRCKEKLYECLCDCGNYTTQRVSDLRHGYVKSCGCFAKDKNKERTRLRPGQNTYNVLETQYKNNAKNKSTPMSYKLNTEEFISIVIRDCNYCGSEPKLKNVFYKEDGTRTLSSTGVSEEWAIQQWVPANGIDRVNSDPNIGYVIENCVPCCFPCNRMKMDLTESEFISQVFKICAFKLAKALKAKKLNIVKDFIKLVRSTLQSL